MRRAQPRPRQHGERPPTSCPQLPLVPILLPLPQPRLPQLRPHPQKLRGPLSQQLLWSACVDGAALLTVVQVSMIHPSDEQPSPLRSHPLPSKLRAHVHCDAPHQSPWLMS